MDRSLKHTSRRDITSILHQLSFWDGLVVASAASAGCEVLMTEDLNSGQVIRGVRIQNPFEL